MDSLNAPIQETVQLKKKPIFNLPGVTDLLPAEQLEVARTIYKDGLTIEDHISTKYNMPIQTISLLEGVGYVIEYPEIDIDKAPQEFQRFYSILNGICNTRVFVFTNDGEVIDISLFSQDPRRGKRNERIINRVTLREMIEEAKQNLYQN